MAVSANEATSEPTHISALDGVRGIAILLVVFFHVVVIWFSVTWRLPPLWIDRTVTNVAHSGWVGVDLFFVLSGFLITRILLAAREGGSYFRSFYARRFLRIFPLYYGFLFLLIVILPNIPGFRGDPAFAKLRHYQFEYWTYLFNVAFSLHPALDRGRYISFHFWSLAVEEQFYLVWPLIVFVLGRRRLGIFCVLCIIAAPIVRYGLLHGAVPQLHNAYAVYIMTPARMDALAIGGLIAVVAVEPELLRKVSRWAMPVGAASALFLAILYVVRGELGAYDEPIQVFGYSAIALTFAAVITMVLGGPTGFLQGFCSHRVLRFFGKYSYGLYVVQPQIMAWLMRLAYHHGAMHALWGSYLPFLIAFTVVATALSVAVAWLSWHLYERHFLKLKRFVPYGRPREHPPARALVVVAVPAEPERAQPV